MADGLEVGVAVHGAVHGAGRIGLHHARSLVEPAAQAAGPVHPPLADHRRGVRGQPHQLRHPRLGRLQHLPLRHRPVPFRPVRLPLGNRHRLRHHLLRIPDPHHPPHGSGGVSLIDVGEKEALNGLRTVRMIPFSKERFYFPGFLEAFLRFLDFT